MPKETTLRLESYFLAFIEDQIAKGRFSSPSAVVQAGLRLLEEHEVLVRTLWLPLCKRVKTAAGSKTSTSMSFSRARMPSFSSVRPARSRDRLYSLATRCL